MSFKLREKYASGDLAGMHHIFKALFSVYIFAQNVEAHFVLCSDAASGLAMDYFKDAGGVKYTSTAELRAGRSMKGKGFVVSREQIQPSFDEFWNGLTTNVAEINRAGAFSPAKPAIVVCVILCKFMSIFQ